MANTYLTRTPSSASNRKTFTLSFWIKRGVISSVQTPFSVGNSADEQIMRFESGDTFYILDYQSAIKIEIRTSRVFRDPSAWYHIVVAVDTTQATASNRVKIYVNGVQETSFGTETYPAQNTDLMWNSNVLHAIGRKESGDNEYFDGAMAHVHFIDGTAYDADTFGETDATTGIWKTKTSPSVSYGTNGFFLDFALSSDMGNDVSGNNNDFTVNGTMTQTIDTPSNVFATFNALYNSNQNLANGNLTATNSTSTWNSRASTLAASKGKYYAEYKLHKPGGIYSYLMLGVGTVEDIDLSTHAGTGTGTVAVYNDSGEKYVENTNTAYANTYGDGDIMGIALDLDNNYVYFSKNGTWQNSGDPTSGASGTGGIALPTTGTYAFTESVRSTNSTATKVEANFGNGYFGTTAVSTPGSHSGVGIFEYDVPSGYKALCTKSINEQEYN